MVIELPVPITVLTVPLPFASVQVAVRLAGTNPAEQTESASAGDAADIAKPSPSAALPSKRVRYVIRFIGNPLKRRQPSPSAAVGIAATIKHASGSSFVTSRVRIHKRPPNSSRKVRVLDLVHRSQKRSASVRSTRLVFAMIGC